MKYGETMEKEVLKILMMNYEYPPIGGGAANATYHFLKEASKFKDIEIDLVTCTLGKTKVSKEYKNITIHYLNILKHKNIHSQSIKDLILYSIVSLLYCFKLKKKKKFDLLHAFFAVPCGYIAFALGIPYIISLRGSDVPFYSRKYLILDALFFSKFNKYVLKGAQKVISVSQYLAKLALRTSPNQRIEVITNGVDVNLFKPNSLKKRTKTLKLISVGRLIPRKGYQYLIPALRNLDVKLTLVGEGKEEQKLKKLAKKYKVSVTFTGIKLKHEVAMLLAESDAFILPSLNEGMSNSVLEAMASGLPIIMTDTGGAQELIRGNGLLVEKKSSDSIRKAIIKLTESEETLKIYSKRSREIAEKMSWINIVEQYKDIYKECIQKM